MQMLQAPRTEGFPHGRTADVLAPRAVRHVGARAALGVAVVA